MRGGNRRERRERRKSDEISSPSHWEEVRLVVAPGRLAFDKKGRRARFPGCDFTLGSDSHPPEEKKNWPVVDDKQRARDYG